MRLDVSWTFGPGRPPSYDCLNLGRSLVVLCLGLLLFLFLCLLCLRHQILTLVFALQPRLSSGGAALHIRGQWRTFDGLSVFVPIGNARRGIPLFGTIVVFNEVCLSK